MKRQLLHLKQFFLNDVFYPLRMSVVSAFGLLPEPRDETRDLELTFEETFEAVPDWNTSFPWGRHNGDLNSKVWLTDGENVAVKDGALQLFLKKEPGVETGWFGTFEHSHTAAHLDTRGKFEQSFGVWDFKIRTPNKKGHWPAVWMLTPDWKHPEAPGDGTILPEIDVMEEFGHGDDKVHFALHTGLDYEKPWRRSMSNSIRKNMSEKWFVLTIDWNERRILWKVNDVPVKVVYQSLLKSHERVHRKMYLVVSNNVANDFEPADSVSDCMSVDWIRVYGKNES